MRSDPYAETDAVSATSWEQIVDGVVQDAVVVIADGLVVFVNEAAEHLWGIGRGDIIGKDPAPLWPAAIRNLDHGGDGERHENLITIGRADGSAARASLRLTTIDTDGHSRQVAVLRDLTDDTRIEALRRNVLEALTSGMSLRDVAGFICTQVEAMAPEVVSSMLLVDEDGRLRPLAAPRLPDRFCAAMDGVEIGEGVGTCGTAAFRGEPVQVVDINTDPLWAPYLSIGLPSSLQACWSSPIKRRDGRVIGTFAFYYREKRGPSAWHEQIVDACLHLCMIAIERHEAKQQIAQLSHFDALTGLPNRTRFHDEIAGSLRFRVGGNVAFFFLDIDRFKNVNEALGHSAGDKLLVEVADRLQLLFHADGTVYRFGGDEFLVVLPDTSAEKASAKAEKALTAFAEPVDISGVSFVVSASIGISLFPENGTDGSVLLQHADTALSEAKAVRRGTYHFFSPEMDRIAQERLVMGAALRKATAQGMLELHYQPQLAPKTLEIFGVEALARWNDPELGRISPEKFIPLAEEIGQIEAIGNWSLREACRQMAEWLDAGIDIPAVSVNLSLMHFRNAELPNAIAGLLREYGLPPERLTVEITESVVMDGSPTTLDTIRAVRALGVGLSMDDFGTGFSSLSSLSRLPVTEVKIDRSFITDFRQDAGALALATAVVRIGQSLGLKVVAEGVETEEQRSFLADLDCHVAQGYLFSRPLPPAALAEWAVAHPKP